MQKSKLYNVMNHTFSNFTNPMGFSIIGGFKYQQSVKYQDQFQYDESLICKKDSVRFLTSPNKQNNIYNSHEQFKFRQQIKPKQDKDLIYKRTITQSYVSKNGCDNQKLRQITDFKEKKNQYKPQIEHNISFEHRTQNENLQKNSYIKKQYKTYQNLNLGSQQFKNPSKKYCTKKDIITQGQVNQKMFSSCQSVKNLQKYSEQQLKADCQKKQVINIQLKLVKQIKSPRFIKQFKSFKQILQAKQVKQIKNVKNETLKFKSSKHLIQQYKIIELQKQKVKQNIKHIKSLSRINYLKGNNKLYQSTISNKRYQITDSSISIKINQSGIDSQQNIIQLTKKNKKYSKLNKTFNSFTELISTPKIDLQKQKSQIKQFKTPKIGIVKTQKKISFIDQYKRSTNQKLSLKDFVLGKALGSGAFGEVLPARHKKTNWLVAIKKIKKEMVKHMLDQLIKQIKIQIFLNHCNLVKMYAFFHDDLHFYIVMQYMQGGSLYHRLKQQKCLSVQQTSSTLKQVCLGVSHMHSSQILHRDIKPENIVLSLGVAKLCDFGWSTICKDRRSTYCGTLDYVSPEIVQGDKYDQSVDLWSIGVLAYQLVTGKTPFYNVSRKQTLKKITNCDFHYPDTMPHVVRQFVQKILRKNPDQRITVDDILKQPLLNLSQQLSKLL